MAHALVSYRSGRALIKEEDGRLYTIDSGEPGEVKDAAGLHTGMYLQGGSDWHEEPAGEYPYGDLASKLGLGYRQHSALFVFLITLDAEMDETTRQGAAEEAEELFADDAVYEWVKDTCLSVAMPAEADAAGGPTTGRAGEILSAMVRKWRNNGAH